MAELIEQYLERFHENFPLFALMGVEEAEVEAIIQDCLDKGTPWFLTHGKKGFGGNNND